MRNRIAVFLMTTALLTAPGLVFGQDGFTDSFMLDACDFSSRGSNPYFILEPGYQLVLEGTEDGEAVRLAITVLNETMTINGVQTRVVEERETQDGELAEVSRNYFAICKQNNSVFYFGEDVDIYDEGVIVGHEGAWQAGVNDARAGLMMPGIALLGARYYQEMAQGVAMDRAEIVSLNETLQSSAGTFDNCLKTKETTTLEPGVEEFKLYAPGVGLIKDGELALTQISGILPTDFNVDFSAATFSAPSQQRIRLSNVGAEFPVGTQIGTLWVEFDFNMNTLGFDLVNGGLE